MFPIVPRIQADFLRFLVGSGRALDELQEAGKSTRKLIGFAVGLRSIGAIESSMLQSAGTAAVAAFHRGALNVTADTGSPIADVGIVAPSVPAVQSASVMV